MEILCPLCGERTPAEPDAQWVYCIHCYRRIEIDPAEVGDHLIPVAERVPLLEGLLAKCIIALEALLESPDLNLDCLEEATHDAIEVARETVRVVKAALEGRTPEKDYGGENVSEPPVGEYPVKKRRKGDEI